MHYLLCCAVAHLDDVDAPGEGSALLAVGAVDGDDGGGSGVRGRRATDASGNKIVVDALRQVGELLGGAVAADALLIVGRGNEQGGKLRLYVFG